MNRILRLWPVIPAIATAAVLGYFGYAQTLPKLDPTGKIDASPALDAMMRGEPVYDTSRWRILFRSDYEGKAEK